MSRYTILVVDDDPDIQELVSIALEEEGYIVFRAVNGDSLPIAVREQPHLVLLDLNMPGMDGATVSRRLRQEPATCHIPIVAMSAVSAGVSHEGLMHEDWLNKPFDLDQLYAIVERWAGNPVT